MATGYDNLLINKNSTATTSTGTTTKAKANDKLESQDFMKLLLAELQHQDPTSPMDTDKMLSQTSQLSALEAQTATKEAMTAMTAAFQASAGFSMASAIGRMADTGKETITVAKGASVTFDAYIPNDTTQASIVIKDGTGNVIKSQDFKDVGRGVITTTWDGTNTAGVKQPDGDYKVSILYNDTNGNPQTSTINKQPISSIRFNTTGDPELKVGSTYIAASKLKEIFNP